MVKDLTTMFIDNGTDAAIVKSITGEDLEKSGHKDRSKLVPVKVQAKGKHGTYTTTVWKSPEEAKAIVPKQAQQQPQEDKKTTEKTSAPKIKTEYFAKSSCGKGCHMETVDVTYTDKKTGETTTKKEDKWIPDVKPVSGEEIKTKLMKHYAEHKKQLKMSYGEFVKSKAAEELLKKDYFISGIVTDKDGNKVMSHTNQVYKDKDGKYTPERQKLHDEIVQRIVDSATTPPEGTKPVAILMGGGSASGKGTCRSKVVMPMMAEQGMTPGIADSDDIKPQLPEYTYFQQQDVGSAAARIHDESSDIANEAIDALIANGKNLLFDGTMKNYDKYIGIIDKLHEAGYEVQIVGVDVDLNEAYKRSDSRAEHTGRKVPHGIIAGSHGGFAATLPKLINKVDSSILYDNENGLKPIMQDGEILDESKYGTFIKKGDDFIQEKRAKDIAKKFHTTIDKVHEYLSAGTSIDEMEDWYKKGWRELE